MAAGEKLLTDEEIEAIEEVVASGALKEGYNIGVDATPFDLTTAGTSNRLDGDILAKINDRFRIKLKAVLEKELRYFADIGVAEVGVEECQSFFNAENSPSQLSVTKLSPLKGESIISVDADVIYSCVEVWFGGERRHGGGFESSREFSATEELVGKKIRVGVYAALMEAWAPILELQCEHVQSETSPQRLDHAGLGQHLVRTRFSVGSNEDAHGFISIIYPLESIKLVRRSLIETPNAVSTPNRLEKAWSKKLSEAVNEVSFEARVSAEELPIPFGRLRRLKTGDTIPLKTAGIASLKINGLSLFDVEIGSRGGKAAVKILGPHKSEKV